MRRPKLRDSNRLMDNCYGIGDIPNDVIVKIGGSIVFLIYTGRKDITGEDWGDMFSKAIDGKHLNSPLGIADVVKGKTAWSMKTVKATHPLTAKKVRLISGRCSPDYSYGIEDPHADIQKTGEAVLAIWNSRVDITLAHYNVARVGVLVRDESLKEFTFFEEYLEHYYIANYIWEENKNGNLIGIEEKSGIKRFTWQPHGSQFTIDCEIPSNAIKFKIKHPEKISEDDILEHLGYNQEWIEIL